MGQPVSGLLGCRCSLAGFCFHTGRKGNRAVARYLPASSFFGSSVKAVSFSFQAVALSGWLDFS